MIAGVVNFICNNNTVLAFYICQNYKFQKFRPLNLLFTHIFKWAINKGFKHGIKLGAAVRSDSYFIGKVVDSNYLTSRILLISDLNSKIPIVIEPGSISAILSGTGNNEFGEIEYLPEKNNIEEGGIVYTSGSDGVISSGIPIGKIILDNNLIKVDYFTDFTQINFVKVYYKK